MACSNEFIEEVLVHLRKAGQVVLKPLFGEYGIYLDGVYCGALCDNQLFIKATQEGKAQLQHEEYGIMYPGAKPSFLISDLQDEDTLIRVLLATQQALLKQKGK